MRNSWSHIRLGDACDIINGRNQKAVEDPSGAFPIYGSGGIMGYANSYLCKGGSTIIGRKGTINRPLYVDKDFWNVDTAFGLSPKAGIAPRFLFYLCKSINWLRYNKSTTLPSLVKSDLLQIPISVPGLEEQHRIVDELDLLTGIIDKKNAQLRDLDALAQSIFYEIFGDPISNEKGWPIKYVGEFADVTDYVANGSFATLRENVSYKSEPDYAILVRLADFSNAFDRSKFVYVDKHAYDFLAKSKLFGGEIIMSNVGSVGKSFICPDLGQPMSLAPNSIVIKTPNNIYSYACFQMPSFQLAIKGITSQTALPKFNKTEFKKIKVICPPAEMQAQYEERWKAIQRQRERIEASLRDAQALLDSRMDYYFND